MKIYRRTPQDVWGINNFRLYLDDLTSMQTPRLKALCKWLDISEKTLHRYMTEATPVPRVVCYALYHESKWGKDLGFTEAYNDRDILTRRIAALEIDNQALAADVETLRRDNAAAVVGAANDAIYTNRPVIAPTKRRSQPPTNFRIHRRFHG